MFCGTLFSGGLRISPHAVRQNDSMNSCFNMRYKTHSSNVFLTSPIDIHHLYITSVKVLVHTVDTKYQTQGSGSEIWTKGKENENTALYF
jgi:hypothetical protein